MNLSGPPRTQIDPRPQELRSHGSISSSINAISLEDCVAVVIVVVVVVVDVVVVVVVSVGKYSLRLEMYKIQALE